MILGAAPLASVGPHSMTGQSPTSTRSFASPAAPEADITACSTCYTSAQTQICLVQLTPLLVLHAFIKANTDSLGAERFSCKASLQLGGRTDSTDGQLLALRGPHVSATDCCCPCRAYAETWHSVRPCTHSANWLLTAAAASTTTAQGQALQQIQCCVTAATRWAHCPCRGT